MNASKAKNSIENLLRRRTGPMTEELRLGYTEDIDRSVPQSQRGSQTASAICGFCSTGCSLDIQSSQEGPLALTPNQSYPVNQGMACPKGWEALTPLFAEDRATQPLLRNDSGALVPTDWDQALKLFTTRFKEIQTRHGPDSLAWIGTGQITVEEFAFLGALGKFGMGIRHGDGNTRQCMATSVAAYKQSFGYDAPPYTYADFELSDTLVFFGANPCIAHPIMWQRVLQNPNRPRIIVVDPRHTETAKEATLSLAIHPKTDLCLLLGVAHRLIQKGAIDQRFIEAHVDGFDAFSRFVEDYPLDQVAETCGVPAADVGSMVDMIAEGQAVSFWWTMGVNQGHQATRTAQGIINLALITGNMGRPGTGANSITGQCNAMGSRLYSNTTNLIGGHDFANPTHRSKVAEILAIPEFSIPDAPSLAYDQILDGIDRGTIKGLWIIATNTAHSWIHQKRAVDVLKKLDCLVVQDMYASTETAQLADIVLPAAGWGEKEGTFINSERRFGVIRKVKRPPGTAMSDFNILRSVAEYWGCGDQFKEWETPENAFQVIKRLSKGQPSDISGIEDYRMIETFGGIQWPFPEDLLESYEASGRSETWRRERQERRLFHDGRFHTASGRAILHYQEPIAPPEPPDDAYPFLLITGRGTSAQWHTNTRTGKSEVLKSLHPEHAYAEIHPDDAKRLGLENRSRMVIQSRRGRVEVIAYVVATVRQGHLFMPMHYRETNQLTYPVFDPHSRQPGYKHCAVSVEPSPTQ